MKDTHDSFGQVYGDVYYDKGNGEFQLLSSTLTEIVSKEVEQAIRGDVNYEHGYHRVNPTAWMITSECAAVNATVDQFGVGDVLNETRITSHVLYRDFEQVDLVQTVVLAEMQYASRVSLDMSNVSVGDLSEEYVTGWLEDRYIIERTSTGEYSGYVEQLDMLKPQGDRHRRPMTLYDAAELIHQVEQMKIV